MGCGGAALDPANRQGGAAEIDLVPAQVHELARAQTVAICNQDHGGIAMAPTIRSGRLDQTLDLGLGQILARPQLGIRAPARGDCPIYSGWGDASEGWFHQRFSSLAGVTIRTIDILRTVVEEAFRPVALP